MAHDAKGYLTGNHVAERLEAMLHDLCTEQPADVQSWLRRWLETGWTRVGGPPVSVKAPLTMEPGGILRFLASAAAEAGAMAPDAAPRAAPAPQERGEWREHIAPAGHQRAGRTFYVNTVTGEKRWEAPSAHEQPGEQPAPVSDEWEAVRAGNGNVFWYNKVTKVKTWERPAGAPEEPPAPVSTSPSDWRCYLSDKPGKENMQWWYNVVTHQKTWQCPEGVDPRAISQGEPMTQSPGVGSRPPAPADAPATQPPAAEQEWEEIATADGRTFYYNRATKKKTWDRPPEYVPPPQRVAAPGEWKIHSTEKRGSTRHWWLNTVTGEKTWTQPPGAPAPPAGSIAESPRGADSSAPPVPSAAPAASEWTAHNAPDGRTFWHNKLTKVKTWIRPDGAPEPPSLTAANPGDWERSKASDGRSFWYNVRTGEKTWQQPHGTEEEPRQGGGLPPGWKEHSADGKVFYVNEITKKKQWEHPGEQY
eukprot:TRINITY_DN30780_c0_g1_i1.p1 TRINITY_DN30780_c0_g1~~TRINITY_DN30780_c0_g1_i1.p1  ORF type:complete len:476 (+),score=113.35 TRINITY_DN30780_c0_g1_i1:83-1510(+)